MWRARSASAGPPMCAAITRSRCAGQYWNTLCAYSSSPPPRAGAGAAARPQPSPSSTRACPCATASASPLTSTAPPDRRRVPTILVRTPYGKGAGITDHHRAFVDRGYAIVVQDVRGRHDSEGVFKPLEQEPADGDDTLNWIARQSWSNGSVGMMGGSYLGIAQWKAAVLNNPHLKAIFPVVSGFDDYRDRFYSAGGAMKLGHRLNWMSDNLRAPGFVPEFGKYVLHLPLRTSDAAATGQTSEMYQTGAAASVL